jgi:hypothetical protein
MKTVYDYLNDPRIGADEPTALREIHAIRLKMYDETLNMTPVQRADYFREKDKRIAADCARLGIQFKHASLPLVRK